MTQPFRPIPASTVNIAASTTSANKALPSNVVAEQAAMVYNSGSGTVFIEFGNSSVAATTTASMPIPAGGWRPIQTGGAAYVAAITASGTATIYFTAGDGI